VSRVVVHIDTLVLRGIGGGDAAAYRRGLVGELAARLADPATVMRLGTATDVPAVKAGVVPVSSRVASDRLGVMSARAIAKAVAP
jgi:hypothetical protein